MNIKRLFDFSLSLFGLCISAPLWFLNSLGIFIEEGFPIFFRQERVGKDGRVFKSVKFRSMIEHTERIDGFTQASYNDPRITRFGALLRKTAMDELPQLWNIFKGDMSFVGPRALVLKEKDVGSVKEKSVFEFPGFLERCKVKPGLTGIAQVFAPRDISRDRKFKYDIWYVHNQGFLLDIYLIVVSFLITFSGKWEDRENRFDVLASRLKAKIEREVGL
jgi:lipopolysaccharide/colanic/teichoic acid biosynthesis glycosyltransferase